MVRPIDLRGHLHFDMTPSGAFLTHLVTSERIPLGQGEWALAFGEDGRQCVVVGVADDGSEKLEVVSERFRFTLCEDDGGEVYIVDTRSAAASTAAMRVETWECKHRQGTIKLKVSSTSATWDFQVAVFNQPRPGGVV